MRRHFDDFVWLHDYLLASLPHCLVPPLPSKKSVLSVESDQQASMIQLRALTKFVNDVVAHDELRRSTAFTQFLTLTDDAAFKGQMKDMSAAVKSSTVSLGMRQRLLSGNSDLSDLPQSTAKTVVLATLLDAKQLT